MAEYLVFACHVWPSFPCVGVYTVLAYPSIPYAGVMYLLFDPPPLCLGEVSLAWSPIPCAEDLSLLAGPPSRVLGVVSFVEPVDPHVHSPNATASLTK